MTSRVRHRIRWTLVSGWCSSALAVLIACAAPAARAGVFASQDAALHAAFPEADRIEPHAYVLDEAQTERIQQLAEAIRMTGAMAPGTPMSDLTNAGDSFRTNALVDNVLVAPDASCDKRAALYANGHDLKDPLLSPVYGDMHGLPPAILTTGTRDLLLSSTVRVHRKLRQAGVDAVLQVYEGQSHGQYSRDVSAPETKEAFEEIAQFFDKHLGK